VPFCGGQERTTVAAGLENRVKKNARNIPATLTILSSKNAPQLR
jgi:hypothetical protein